ncbi:hypothetical protein QOT17_011823 [Balamuthia mandrillaris]
MNDFVGTWAAAKNMHGGPGMDYAHHTLLELRLLPDGTFTNTYTETASYPLSGRPANVSKKEEQGTWALKRPTGGGEGHHLLQLLLGPETGDLPYLELELTLPAEGAAFPPPKLSPRGLVPGGRGLFGSYWVTIVGFGGGGGLFRTSSST